MAQTIAAMGNPAHMSIALKSSVSEWNKWRDSNLRTQPDLTRIDLSGRNLSGIDFRGVGLFKANLSRANLRGAILRQSIMIEANIMGADLTGAHVYGVSAWDLKTARSVQNDLVITKPGATAVTCDNIEVAQMIHLLISNPKTRDVIDAIARKSVLILGRFTPSRKAVLDMIRNALRKKNLLPVVFDFDGPTSRDVTDTVKILALLSRAVIADVTDPASSPYELGTIVPMIKSPVFPLVLEKQRPFGMMKDLERFPWFKGTQSYRSRADLERRVIPGLVRAIAAC
jgi:hypothetical protein